MYARVRAARAARSALQLSSRRAVSTYSSSPLLINTASTSRSSSDVSVLNDKIGSAAARGELAKVLAFTKYFREGHATPTVDSYNNVLSVFAGYGLLDEAWALIPEMEAAGIKPTVETYNQLIRAAINTPEAIYSIVEHMKFHEIALNAKSYEYIMAHWANFLNVPMCVQTLTDVQATNDIPTLKTVELAVHTAARQGYPKLALQLAEQMEGSSTRRLQGQAWTDILIASAQVYWAEGCQRAWSVVSRFSIMPDEGLCTSILATAARHGLPELATDVIRVMRTATIPIQEHHLASLLDSFVAADKLKEALEIVGLFGRTTTIDITAETTHSIYRAISKSIDTVDTAFTYLEQIAKDAAAANAENRNNNEGGVHPSALNTVIAAAVSLGDMQRAIGIYKEAPSLLPSHPPHLSKPNAETLNALLSGCISLSHKALGEMLLGEFQREHGILPDAGTYERLVLLCLTQATYEEAFVYLEDMKSKGFKPSYAVYESLIRKMISVGDKRWKLAQQELEEAGYKAEAPLEQFIRTGGQELRD